MAECRGPVDGTRSMVAIDIQSLREKALASRRAVFSRGSGYPGDEDDDAPEEGEIQEIPMPQAPMLPQIQAPVSVQTSTKPPADIQHDRDQQQVRAQLEQCLAITKDLQSRGYKLQDLIRAGIHATFAKDIVALLEAEGSHEDKGVAAAPSAPSISPTIPAPDTAPASVTIAAAEPAMPPTNSIATAKRTHEEAFHPPASATTLLPASARPTVTPAPRPPWQHDGPDMATVLKRQAVAGSAAGRQSAVVIDWDSSSDEESEAEDEGGQSAGGGKGDAGKVRPGTVVAPSMSLTQTKAVMRHNDGLAKLRRVEDEIARAMTALNKAQEQHTARKRDRDLASGISTPGAQSPVIASPALRHSPVQSAPPHIPARSLATPARTPQSAHTVSMVSAADTAALAQAEKDVSDLERATVQVDRQLDDKAQLKVQLEKQAVEIAGKLATLDADVALLLSQKTQLLELLSTRKASERELRGRVEKARQAEPSEVVTATSVKAGIVTDLSNHVIDQPLNESRPQPATLTLAQLCAPSQPVSLSNADGSAGESLAETATEPRRITSSGISAAGRHESSSPEVAINSTGPADHAPTLSTYISPFERFTAFRYHVLYPRRVKHGYRSLTYFHKIRANEAACEALLTSTCGKTQCPHYHLDDIAMTDDDILIALSGTPKTLKTAKQRQSFRESLRQLLSTLRDNQVDDFEMVARAIAAHARQAAGGVGSDGVSWCI
ncbi:hypothetical protein PYCC9005_001824 [Savitreella phatthalungensis]